MVGQTVSESTELYGFCRTSRSALDPVFPLLCFEGLATSVTTEESSEADKDLFRLTPHGALPDW